ncbi:MAG: FG-GAP repeat protein [Planctomycetes bacterium]|nr:FG-GAP repeat protein [Planctomycetota bacterium]
MSDQSNNVVTGPSPAAMLAVAAVLVLGGVLTAPASAQCLANETQKLTASDADQFDLFGTAVAIHGDLILIGAILDDDGGLNTGAVYVLRFDPATSQWIEEQKLTAIEPVPQTDFGIYVSITEDLALIGAWRDGENGYTAGSAYIFRFDPETSLWVQEQKLLASDGTNFDRFGSAVSIWGDVAMVGAYLDDDPVPDTGSVYVFQYDPDSGIWNEVQKLIPDEIGRFGRSVSLQGDTALIGTCCDLEMGFQAGAAYVYRFDPDGSGQWIQEQKLVASDGDDNDIFGWSVSLDGDVALIGAYADEVGPLFGAGSAYVFRFNGSQWVQEQKLTASDPASEDFFGWSVSLHGDLALIGAILDDDYANGSGSSYIFTFDGKQWSEAAKLRYEAVQGVHAFGVSVATDGEHAIVGANFTTVDEQAEAGAAYIYGGLGDCNENGELDLCDIADGFSPDDNNNGIPDECEIPGDLDGDREVGVPDLLILLGNWGPCDDCNDCLADIDDDCTVGVKDLLILLGNWG